MKIKNNFDVNFILSILFGSPLILLIIWNRFIRIRLPRDLTHILIFDIIHCIIVLLFFINLLLFIYYFRKFYNYKSNPNSKLYRLVENIDYFIKKRKILNKIITEIISIIEQHVIYGPHRIYDRLYKNINIIKNISDTIIKYIFGNMNVFFWENVTERTSILIFNILCISTMILPRFIPMFLFLIEILYFQHLEYFYKSLFLLGIPLLTNILMFIAKHNCELRMDIITEYYTVDYIIHNRENTKYNITITKKDDKNETDFYQFFKNFYQNEEQVCEMWIKLQSNYNVIGQLEITIEKYKNGYKTFLYFCYSVAFFFYILILMDLYPIFILKEYILILMICFTVQMVIFYIILLICYYHAIKNKNFIETCYTISLDRETNKIIYLKKNVEKNKVDEKFNNIHNIITTWEFNNDFIYESLRFINKNLLFTLIILILLVVIWLS